MMFNIGDSVIFDNSFNYNDQITYDKNKSYTIVNIHYSDNSKTEMSDIFIDIDPKRALYYKRFLLDIKQTRKNKLKKIYEKEG